MIALQVKDDAVMPAPDYRLPRWLSATGLSLILRTLTESGKAVGAEITVFNPADQDGSIVPRFARSIADGLVLGRRSLTRSRQDRHTDIGHAHGPREFAFRLGLGAVLFEEDGGFGSTMNSLA